MKELIKSNFRKGRVGLAVVAIFIILAVFLLTSGLTLIIKTPSLHADKAQELGSADMLTEYSYAKEYNHSQQVVDKIATLDYVKNVAYYKKLLLRDGVSLRYPSTDGWSANAINIINKDQQGEYLPNYITKAEGEGIPLYFGEHTVRNNTVSIGQQLDLVIQGQTYKGYVAGYFESILLLYSGMNLFAVPQNDYEFFEGLQATDKETAKLEMALLYVKFSQPYTFALKSQFYSDSIRISNECRNQYIADNNIPEFLHDKVGMNTGHTGLDDIVSGSQPFMLIVSVALIVFSLVMTIVALIIINFLVRSGIEDDMRNIGVLKAVGYTSAQLRKSYLAMYGILIVLGAIIGMIVGVAMMPVFNEILSLIANMKMTVSIVWWTAVVAVILPTAVALLAVGIITKRLKNVTPLFAIRRALYTHSFKKNAAPLEKSKVGINTALGIKAVLQNKRQSIMTLIIAGVMTLICAFSTVMYYNMNVDKSAMIAVSGIEPCDVAMQIYFKDTALGDNDAVLDNEKKAKEYFDRLSEFPEVEKINFHTVAGHLLWLNDKNSVTAFVAKDYTQLEMNPIYKGRMPTLATECAISGDIAKALKLDVGDVIQLNPPSQNEGEEVVNVDMTIVGLAQGLALNRVVMLNEEAFKKILQIDNVVLSEKNKYIYLHPGHDTREFVVKARNLQSTMFEGQNVSMSLQDGEFMMNSRIFDVVSPATTILMNVVLAVSVIVVSAVVFMTIRMKMLREKKNIAINKALGYTSWQIMHQTGLAVLLVAMPAAIIGALLGAVLVNPFMLLIGTIIGLYKVSFVINYGIVLAIGIVLAVLNYIVALLVSLSTRFISPRLLVSQ